MSSYVAVNVAATLLARHIETAVDGALSGGAGHAGLNPPAAVKAAMNGRGCLCAARTWCGGGQTLACALPGGSGMGYPRSECPETGARHRDRSVHRVGGGDDGTIDRFRSDRRDIMARARVDEAGAHSVGLELLSGRRHSVVLGRDDRPLRRLRRPIHRGLVGERRGNVALFPLELFSRIGRARRRGPHG